MVTLLGRAGSGPAAELLALAVRRHCGLERLPETARLSGGKPWFPACPGIHFNLSHSGGLILCAVGDAPLGVDIETVRPRRESLPRHVLDGGEYAWFTEGGSRWEDFYALWTLKESRCKYTGQGLDRPARAIRVPPLRPGETGKLDGLTFHAYGGKGWRAALCAAAPETLPGEIDWI